MKPPITTVQAMSHPNVVLTIKALGEMAYELREERDALKTELVKKDAEIAELAKFVIEVGGFWGNTKSVLIGPDSLAASINRGVDFETKLIQENNALTAERDRLQELVAGHNKVVVELAKSSEAVRAERDALKALVNQQLTTEQVQRAKQALYEASHGDLEATDDEVKAALEARK